MGNSSVPLFVIAIFAFPPLPLIVNALKLSILTPLVFLHPMSSPDPPAEVSLASQQRPTPLALSESHGCRWKPQTRPGSTHKRQDKTRHRVLHVHTIKNWSPQMCNSKMDWMDSYWFLGIWEASPRQVRWPDPIQDDPATAQEASGYRRAPPGWRAAIQKTLPWWGNGSLFRSKHTEGCQSLDERSKDTI